MLLPQYGLVTFTWGNVSGIDRKEGLIVIKPSGVEYDKLTPDNMVVLDLKGNKVEAGYNSSSDTATHLELYNRFPNIGGIVHTHSSWATRWAQAGRGSLVTGLPMRIISMARCPASGTLRQRRLRKVMRGIPAS